MLGVAVLIVSAYPSGDAGAIAYGDESLAAQAPEGIVGIHQDRIRRPDPRNRYCTGTVLARRWVVTAAHCVDWAVAEPEVLRVGVQRAGSIEAYPIERIVLHPGRPEQGPKKWKNLPYLRGFDIALLRTAEPIRGVRPIPLARIHAPDSGTHVLYGFGEDERGEPSERVRARVVDIARGEYPGFPKVRTEMQFTTIGTYETYDADGMAETGEDSIARKGDSGGPVLRIGPDGRYVLVGLVSYGPASGGTWPAVHTKLPYYYDWIVRTLGQ